MNQLPQDNSVINNIPDSQTTDSINSEKSIEELMKHIEINRLIFFIRFIKKNITYDIPVSEFYEEDFKSKYRGFDEWTDEMFQKYIDRLIIPPKEYTSNQEYSFAQNGHTYQYRRVDMLKFYQDLGPRELWQKQKQSLATSVYNWEDIIEESWLSLPPINEDEEFLKSLENECYLFTGNKFVIADCNFDHARVISEKLYRYFPNSDYFWNQHDFVSVPSIGISTIEIARIVFSISDISANLFSNLLKKFSGQLIQREKIGKIPQIYNGLETDKTELLKIEDGVYIWEELAADDTTKLFVQITEEYPGILQMDEQGIMRFSLAFFIKLIKLADSKVDENIDLVYNFLKYIERDWTISNWDKELLIKILG